MTLSASINTDAAIFTRVDDFGETITYTPRGGVPVQIPAVVRREGPTREREAFLNIKPGELFVHIRRHATLGRPSIDTGGDTVTVARRPGETPIELMVRRVIGADSGMWRLLCG